METKRVILIRHAQSQENVKVYGICEGLIDMRQGKLSSIGAVLTGSCSLLNSTLDSPLSELGKRQIADMKLILRTARFWEKVCPEVVLHSPLQRARDTLYGTLPPPLGRVGMVIRELADLREATPYEHVVSASLNDRIRAFEAILRSEEYAGKKTIVVCGHSQYFKKMLGMKIMMQNNDVWEVEFGFERGAKQCVWGSPKLLHRTVLAQAHPWDRLVGNIPYNRGTYTDARDPPSSNGAEPEGEDLVGDLRDCRMCRICTLSEEEVPDQKLIRPCSCKGTQEFVHIKCLNRWRATSSAASSVCPVCKFRYRVTRGPVAAFILSNTGAIVITLVTVMVAAFLCGWLLSLLPKDYRLLGRVLSFADIDPNSFYWWESCSTTNFALWKSVLKKVNENRHGVPGPDFTLMSYVRFMMTAMGGLLTSTRVMCNPITKRLLSFLVEGLCVLIALHLSIFTYQNAKIVIQDPQNDRPAVHEARGKLIHVLILVCGPLLDNGHGGTAQFRMLFCLGFLLMGMDLLGDLRTRGKTFADSFGERILERTT